LLQLDPPPSIDKKKVPLQPKSIEEPGKQHKELDPVLAP
jgi:hypothetical protein